MQITTCLPRKKTQARQPLLHAPPREQTHLSPASSTFTGSPRPGKSAQLSALAARLGQSSGGDNQNDASFSFPPNAVFQEWERLKSECKRLFTRSQYFHKIMLLGREWITQLPGSKMWLSGDCEMEATEQGNQTVEPHPVTSQNSHPPIHFTNIYGGPPMCPRHAF